MSVNIGASIIYGVRLNQAEIRRLRQEPTWEDFYDEYCINSNEYSSADEGIVAGIITSTVDEGDVIPLDLTPPNYVDLNALTDTLHMFGITRAPTWHLVCRVY